MNTHIDCRLTARRSEHFLAAHALHVAAARNRAAHVMRYAMSLDLIRWAHIVFAANLS